LPLPTRPEDASDRAGAHAYLGITHSHPDWLISRWLERYGFHNTEQWVRFNNETPPLTIRANRLRVTREQLAASLAAEKITTEPTRWAPDGLVVRSGNPLRGMGDLPPAGGSDDNGGSPGSAGRYAGWFVVQDEASQLVSLAVDVQPGARVLDLCASPGGKTTAMAAAAGSRGVMVASDVRRRRVRTLADTVRKAEATNVRIVQVPTTGPLPFRAVFDRVLVDAPCSGLGTIRRDPDIRWRRTEDDLGPLRDRQVELLRRAATAVSPGGRLVYATCSSEPEENESVIQQFLVDEPAFSLLDLRGASPLIDPFTDANGMLHTLPFAHGLEAFFAAALVRQ
jgi:16S rRNA (cytosine967-C5)-methyltransferase